MLAQLLALWLGNLFGKQFRKVPPPLPKPKPEKAPENSVVVPASTPNIVVPKPENKDAHGPASSIARAMLKKGYDVFDSKENPWNLNIVGVRTRTPEFDRFRCRLVHFYREATEWKLDSWGITTLPGKTYMVDRLLNPRGCAILAPGQNKGVYALDYHRGVYQALCQRNGSVRVFRDKDRDREYDMDPATIQVGSFGINVHATENPDDGISNPVADRIGSASAGCLVFARVNDFVTAREQWRKARSAWGAKFTLTLLDEADLDDVRTIPHEDLEPQKSDAEDWKPGGTATTGTRNRNLLNVKQGSDPWKYSTGKDSRGHAIFPNYAAGVRAGIVNLRSYWTRHGLKTLSGICNRWAPTSDTVGSIPGAPANNPNGYADFLAKRMGVKVTDTLGIFNGDGTVRDADQLFKLVSGMVVMENHVGVVLPRSVFDKALTLL